MSITDHPGFNTAISECGLTAWEAEAIYGVVRSVEKALLGSAQCGPDAAQDRLPPLQDQAQCHTAPVPSSAKCTGPELLRTQCAPSEDSASNASLAHLTAGEIMRADEIGVQSTRSERVAG